MGALMDYATEELNRLCDKNGDMDPMQEKMNNDILDIVERFSDQGHSGFSAGYALSILDRLLRFKPITPLTGEDSEWVLVYNQSTGKKIYQNNRCSSVFKVIAVDGEVTVHDNDSVSCSDNGGITWFSGYTTRKYLDNIAFPYTPPLHPRKIYIEYTEPVPAGFTGEKYDDITNDPDRIQKLHDKKRKEFDKNE